MELATDDSQPFLEGIFIFFNDIIVPHVVGMKQEELLEVRTVEDIDNPRVITDQSLSILTYTHVETLKIVYTRHG